MALTLSEANQVVHAAVAKAQELNIRISVAVCDAGGRLVASIAWTARSGPARTARRARPSPRWRSGAPAASSRSAPAARSSRASPRPRAGT